MNRCTMIALVLLAGLIMCQSSQANANIWGVENGVKIRQGDHIMWTKTVVNRADGGYGVAWSAATHGTQNVYMQVYDVNGTPIWGDDGIQITSDLWAQERPILAAMPNGDWVVGWRDYRFGTDKFDPGVLVLQRLTPDGEMLWPHTGIVTWQERYDSHQIYLFPSVGDDVLACWGTEHLYAQRYTLDGTPFYPDPIMVAAEDPRVVVTDDLGGIWVMSRGHNTPYYINHLLPAGILSWSQPGLDFIPHWPYSGLELSAVPDGSHGVYVTWSRNLDTEYSVYGQHVSTTGDLLWPIDEEELLYTPQRPFQSRSFSTGQAGEFFLSWQLGDWGQQNEGMRLQKFVEVDGLPEAQWGDAGVEVGTGNDKRTSRMSVLPDDQGGAWVSSVGYVDDQYGDMVSSIDHFTDQGNQAWQEGAFPTAVWDCGGMSLVRCGDELRAYSMEHFPYNDQLHVKVIDGASGSVLDDYAEVAGVTGNISQPTIRRSGQNVWLFWADYRAMDWGQAPFAQVIDFETGQPYFQDAGINLAPALEDPADNERRVSTYNHNVTGTTDQAAVFGWKEHYYDGDMDGVNRAMLQRVGLDGQLQLGETGLIVPTPDGFREDNTTVVGLEKAENGAAFLYILLVADDEHYELWINRLSAGGELEWGGGYGLPLVDLVNYVQLWDVYQLNDGSMIVMFSQYSDYHHQLTQAIRVGTDGSLLWPEPVTVIDHVAPYYNLQWQQSVILDDYIITGSKTSDSGASEEIIRLQGVDFNGNILWPDGPLEFDCDTYHQWVFNLAPAEHNSFWLALEGEPDYELTKYDINGVPWDRDPICIGGEESLFTGPQLVGDGGGGFYAAWYAGESWVETDFKYTHVMADGRFALLHNRGGEYFNNAPYECGELYTTSDGEGGMLATWNDWRGRSGEMEGDDVYCIRLNEMINGAPEPQQGAFAGEWALDSVWPNPFNPSTTVRFTLAARCNTKVTIVDVLGREVATLLNRNLPAGSHEISWSGRMNLGSQAPSGVYFVRLETPEFNAVRKAVLVK